MFGEFRESTPIMKDGRAIVEFQPVKAAVEVFGVINRPQEPSVRDLMIWDEFEMPLREVQDKEQLNYPRNRQTRSQISIRSNSRDVKKSELRRENHGIFKCSQINKFGQYYPEELQNDKISAHGRCKHIEIVEKEKLGNSHLAELKKKSSEQVETEKGSNAKIDRINADSQEIRDSKAVYTRLARTSYQDMTSKATINRPNQIVAPFKYCAKCRGNLFEQDLMRPPYSLAEIPPQELNPKVYQALHPKWTLRIPAAGKLSYRSPAAYTVTFGDNQPFGGVSS